MDGFQARLTTHLRLSLQFRLSFYLALTSLIVALVAGIGSFASALNEAHELQDDLLRQIAVLAALTPNPHADGARTELSSSDANEETRITVQWLPKPGTGPKRLPPDLLIPNGMADGFHTLAMDGEDFRVMVQTLKDGSRVVAAQEAGMRNEIARGSALRTIAPLLILAPVLVLMVAILVRHLLTPLARLSDEMNARPEQALHAVDAKDVPVELQPFLRAINGLLGKVKQSMDAQRRFLADAAHELRSPLAALSLQSERLSQADMSDAARERLNAVRLGIERGRHLLEQLLALARAQNTPSEQAPKPAPVSVRELGRRVIEDFISLAESKNIDLGMPDSDEAVLAVDEMMLLTAMKNLVDNAIRYSPQGGRVDLGVRTLPDAITVWVCDQGPGIPEAERARVFDPFYRVLGSQESGSGLGLAIVKEITDRLGASGGLADTDPHVGKGLTVTLHLPIRGAQREC